MLDNVALGCSGLKSADTYTFKYARPQSTCYNCLLLRAVASVLSSATTDWWWMRERPVYMVKQITAFLGRPWEIWMKWPHEVIDRYQDTNHSVGMNTHLGIVEHASSENNTTLGVLSRTLPHHRKIGADKLPHRLS